jgi:hypothetical protein
MPSEAGATPASACPQPRQNDCWARRAPRTAGTPPPERRIPRQNRCLARGRAAPARHHHAALNPQRSRPDSPSRWPFHGTLGSSWRAGNARSSVVHTPSDHRAVAVSRPRSPHRTATSVPLGTPDSSSKGPGASDKPRTTGLCSLRRSTTYSDTGIPLACGKSTRLDAIGRNRYAW